MTAVIIARQSRRGLIHMMTDRAVYYPDGSLADISSKVAVVPSWPGAITGRGGTLAVEYLQDEIASRFGTFDEMVGGIESDAPEMFASMPPYLFVAQNNAEIILAGVSRSRGPESYVFYINGEVGIGAAEAEREQKRLGMDVVVPQGGKLIRLPDFVATPVVSGDTIIAAQYQGIDLDGRIDDAIATMRLVIEMQRHDKVAGDFVAVGGAVELTTISASGVESRVIDEWPEDRVGECIRPTPVNWSAWKAAHQAKRAAAEIPEGLSRLQRQRMEKKMRKGTLQVVPHRSPA